MTTTPASNPQAILTLLLSIQSQIKAYSPSGETAGSVRLYYMQASDTLDRIVENINLAYILESGGFLDPGEFGQ